MPKPKELPKLEDWKAPWEVNAEGEDIPEDEQKIDTAKLKKYLYGLLSDKNRFATRADEATAKVDELETKLAEATDPKKLEELQAEVTKARKEAEEAREKAKGDLTAVKWEIALEKGLTKTQAKRLVGNSREELEADADELLAEFGHRGKPGEREEEGDDLRQAPRRRLQSAGDPDPDAGKGNQDKKVDPDKVVQEYLRNR